MTLLRKSGGDITIVCGRGRSPITAIYNTDTHEHIYQRDKDKQSSGVELVEHLGINESIYISISFRCYKQPLIERHYNSLLKHIA